MKTKMIAWWLVACAACMAGPGVLDRNFAPELRAWVAPDHVTIAPDGRAWIGGGFDRADGKSTGDLLRLGKNGGVADEPAPGYLGKPPGIGGGYAYVPFPLANGDFLLPGESGGWLRMTAAGQPSGKGFPDRQATEAIAPLFERAGKLWDLRRFADGRQSLERRNGDHGVDGRFSLAVKDVLGAVPGPDDSVWVLAGADDFFDFSGTPTERRVFRADAMGAIVGETRTISVSRTITLVAGPAGSFRLEYGPDRSRWLFWPAPTAQTFRIEWYSATGALERGQDFALPLFANFAWAEAADGSFVATDARRPAVGSSLYFIADTADLRRFRADGSEDTTFHSPGPVRSVKALADGKWLVDGLRRLDADGSEDPTWTAPELTRPAEISALLELPGGSVLAGGNFAMADGRVRNRLVVFRKGGKVDPDFEAEERVQEWKSLAVSGGAIHVVTAGPVAYGNGFRSNLVKLGPDGALDETYEPQVPSFTPGERFQTVSDVDRVTALADGAILVETSVWGGDVVVHNVLRLNADGSRDTDFRAPRDYRGFSHILALDDGGYVGDGVIFRRNGKVSRDLTRTGISLRPLCDWLGGVVFLETRNSATGRLRLWAGNHWVPWFQPQLIGNANEAVAATADDTLGLYVSATWTAGRPELRRLLPNGRMDRRFHAPGFGKRERQKPGNWWKAEDGKRVRFDPQAEEIPVSPAVLLWQPATRQFWTGGDFNVAGGKPRDGLARVAGF